MSRTRLRLRALAPNDLAAANGGVDAATAYESYEVGRLIVGTAVGIMGVATIKGAIDYLSGRGGRR
jgi:hypothetical protein